MPKLELLQGTLDLLILKALSLGPMHGYAIVRSIQSLSAGDLVVEEGALYPALHRLEKKGWLDSEWGLTETNRQAKFYRLSQAGKAQLRAETSRWNEHASAVRLVLDASRGTTP